MNTPSYLLTERTGPIAIVTLNRPEVLNALSHAVLSELCDTLEALAGEPQLRAIILTGSRKAFAAGADIRSMVNQSPKDVLESGTRSYWERLRKIQKPIIAAVSGYAFGGGCELAMTCDLIVASETAQFGQPEIKLGIMPGAGGTQRLVKALGPYRAMELILTGDPLSARQAYEFGLVNRVVPVERLLDEALELAQTIAARPPVAIRMAREAVRHGVETTLREGIEIERRNYTLLYDTHDQKEGMQAFLEKRKAEFRGE